MTLTFVLIGSCDYFHWFSFSYAHEGNRTFCTKDFLHKSFSTSFGSFTQFLVVILHNNQKWETSNNIKGIQIDTDKTFHLHKIQRWDVDIYGFMI